jgi:CopG family transcriptional regulator/antitoxin EndoAI
MNKRINIVLPEKTVAVLDRLTTKGTRSRFINQAVVYFVDRKGKQNIRKLLKAGCQANAERDLEIAAEWFPLDEEAWQTLDDLREGKKPARPKSA